MLELEKWIYGIRRILERNQIPHDQSKGIIQQLRDGDPHGMAKMMLDDILGPRGNEMMPRPEKRNGLWKQSGEWPLTMRAPNHDMSPLTTLSPHHTANHERPFFH